jgi:hypothetical protein
MGGSSDKAAKQAEANEKERLASIQQTQGAVNRVFDGPEREADIGTFMSGLREFLGDDLNRQKADTDRQLRFALARNGQLGGSTQVDQQRRFGEQYSRGLLDAERRVQGAGADLRSQDQDARARLIQLATSGLDATTAAQQSAASMRSALESGRSTAMAQGMGNAFGTFGDFFQQSKDAAARRRADRQAYPLYGSNTYGGS